MSFFLLDRAIIAKLFFSGASGADARYIRSVEAMCADAKLIYFEPGGVSAERQTLNLNTKLGEKLTEVPYDIVEKAETIIREHNLVKRFNDNPTVISSVQKYCAAQRIYREPSEVISYSLKLLVLASILNAAVYSYRPRTMVLKSILETLAKNGDNQELKEFY